CAASACSSRFAVRCWRRDQSLPRPEALVPESHVGWIGEQPLKIGPAFERTAAISSAISAITTSMLIFLPLLYAPTDGFEGRMAAVHDPWYSLRSWAYLVHPFLTFTAALGMCLRIRFTAATAAIVG